MVTNRDDPTPEATDSGNGSKGKASDHGVHVGPSASTTMQTDFSTLVLSMAEAAMLEMGLGPRKKGETIQKDLKMAQHTIDILHMLKEKTAGNLTEAESKLLHGILYQLHLCFVDAKAKT